jgi:nucleoside 2-deoxyribosyltransferase
VLAKYIKRIDNSVMSQRKPEGYVASPYGFAESTKYFYEKILIPMVSQYISVLDPWKVNVDHILSAPKEQQPELWLNLGDYHFRTIAHRAKILIAGLDQEPPDSGTVAEVVWAAAHKIPVIGYRSDFRTAGEDGLPYNLMIGAAIRRSGGIAVASVAELEQELEARVPGLSS